MKPADRLSAFLAKLDEDSRPDRQIYRDLVRAIRPFGRHNGILDIIHREIHPMARKRRAVEQEAWHLAVSLRLPVAALPWPLSPDDDGNLSLREHELLWWHLMGRGDPWSRIDAGPLHGLPPWPANPVLCALWRSATRQGLDTLTDCHRATVAHASSVLGLASLVLEEARHRAGDDQTVEPFIVNRQAVREAVQPPTGGSIRHAPIHDLLRRRASRRRETRACRQRSIPDRVGQLGFVADGLSGRRALASLPALIVGS